MEMKKMFRTGIVLALVALSAVSCVTNRKIAYLQDMKHMTQIELENRFEAVISPYDELDVIVSSFDQELARPFNLRSANANNYQGTGLGYLVDQYGNIELPVLGEIHAAGMTRLKLQEHIKNMLIAGGYISDPYVMVRFRNFKIFVLGSNGGRSITIPEERCTFLQALAMAGSVLHDAAERHHHHPELCIPELPAVLEHAGYGILRLLHHHRPDFHLFRYPGLSEFE